MSNIFLSAYDYIDYIKPAIVNDGELTDDIKEKLMERLLTKIIQK